MKKFIVIAMACVALFGFTATANAQYEVGTKLGYADATGDWGDAFDGAFAGGLYLNYNVKPNVTIQGSWMWHRHKTNDDASAFLNAVSSLDLGLPSLADVRLTFNQFDINAYYKFPMDKVTPFVLAGVGLDYWKIDGKQIVGEFDTNTEETFWDFELNVGGGLDFKITEQVKLGGEIVYTYVFDEFDSGFWSYLATLSYGFGMGGM
jgi:opacity protein-like surface antigen